jgi:integrase
MFVNRSSDRMLKYIIPMLLLTGARKREVLDARWVDMDIERRFWRIPRTKSGKERYVPLSDAAIELLSRVPRRKHGEYIFANHRTHQPFGCVYRSWNRARKLAGMPACRSFGCMICGTALRAFWSMRGAACMKYRRFWDTPASP